MRGPWRMVDQTILATDPRRLGNCVSACVATFLQVPLTQVPHFVEVERGELGDVPMSDDDQRTTPAGGVVWWWLFRGFLAGHGYWVAELDALSDVRPDEIVFVAGPSPRGVLHQVLYRGDQLWHDPHPSKAGLVEVREVLRCTRVGFDHRPTDVIAGAPSLWGQP